MNRLYIIIALLVFFSIGIVLSIFGLIEGIIINEIDNTAKFGLLLLSIALALGTGYGFDKIYDEKLTNRIRYVIKEHNLLYDIYKKQVFYVKKKGEEGKGTRIAIGDSMEPHRKKITEEFYDKYISILKFRKTLFSIMYISSFFFLASIIWGIFIYVAIILFLSGFLILSIFMLDVFSLLDMVSLSEVTNDEIINEAKRDAGL